MPQFHNIIFKDGSKKLINLRNVLHIDLNHNTLNITYNTSSLHGVVIFGFGGLHSNYNRYFIEYDTPQSAQKEYDNIVNAYKELE